MEKTIQLILQSQPLLILKPLKMKSNFLPTRIVVSFFNTPIKRVVLSFFMLLSVIQVAKADPNVEAKVLSITNDPDVCAAGGGNVTVGFTPAWVIATYDTFYITSVELYVLEDRFSGPTQEKLIATAGQQSAFQTSVDFNGVKGIGLLRVRIEFYFGDYQNPTESGIYSYESGFGDSPDYLLAAASPVINSLGVNNADLIAPGSFKLLKCFAGDYDLVFDIDHVFGSVGEDDPTAIFEIYSVDDCDDDLLFDNRVFYSEFYEPNTDEPFLEGFLAEANEEFRELVDNSSGKYKLRLFMEGGFCGGRDQEEIICINISEIPEFDDLYLIKNDEQPSTPLDTVPAPDILPNADTIGGLSGGLWAQLSSSDYDYFRFRLEYDGVNFGTSFNNVPLKSSYSSNNTNVGGTLSVQFNTMILNSSDFLFSNLGVYRVFLIVGVNGCSEDSVAGYFWVTSPWQFKSADANGVGVSLPADNQVEIYPIPASSHLMVQNGTNYYEASYQLIGISGKVMTEDKLGAYNNIDISYLPRGIYFIRCVSKEGEVFHYEKVLIH